MAACAPPAQAIGRALDVLLCFTLEEPELSATELARRLGLHKSTAHRIASYLVARGFLVQDPLTARLRLGLKLVELGSLALRQMDLRREARPHLSVLAARTEESAFLAVRDGDVAVYLDVVESHRTLVLTAYPGRRVALHSSGTGKALLAHLPELEIDRIIRSTGLPRYTANTLADPAALQADLEATRARGYSFDDEETQEGSAGVGAPIRDASGLVVASVSIGAPPSRLQGRLSEIAAAVKETALAVSHALGHRVSHLETHACATAPVESPWR
ncbi:MAG: IclR family transcriptional regulator [Chloroflexi bacterium]|nr:IclR family transcriptional regulator [Chloroflexota bacterium]